ncbi:MAG TPA: GTPase HflX [Planctomycetota bacterium]|jgi:GTP-binding protein HflX|nr:GTPase HflX [Planctomycetota bacterium]
MIRSSQPTQSPGERVLVCGARGFEAELGMDEDLVEARGLAVAAGAEVVGAGVLQRKPHPDSATLFGRGKVEEIHGHVQRFSPTAVVVDNDLTPAQVRNLEKAWGVRVVDRSELILDIFARRAQTRQARLQVELAQNEYLAPRLKRMWTHLERTEGAIGTRGPGETQLETDKRLLKKRILVLRDELREIEARRLREVNSRSEQFTVGLVGYTNAGKSTLLNRLTGAREFVADQLFATLDTRTRQWKLPDGRTVLLSDTVGFLQRLPHHLVSSFQATLEETLAADVLLHVIDGSHPRAGAQIQAVEDVLATLSRNARSAILVFNKIDRLDDRIGLQLLRNGRAQEAVYVSAATGEGLDRLAEAVAGRLDAQSALVDVFVPVADGRLDASVRRLARPIEDEMCPDGREHRLRVRLSEGALGSLRHAGGAALRLEVVAPARDGEAALER